jgi:hypothetical protein
VIALVSHTIENIYFTGFAQGWQESSDKMFLNYNFLFKTRYVFKIGLVNSEMYQTNKNMGNMKDYYASPENSFYSLKEYFDA